MTKSGVWTTEKRFNECGVGIHHIFKDGVEVGHVHSTFHPTIPYEVYWGEPLQSKRCMTVSTGVEIVKNAE